MAALSVSAAQTVASKQRPEGRQILADALGWDKFDEDDNLRQAIILDYHYDNVMFCVHKGFPWKQVCALTDLAGKMLDIMEGKLLAECVQQYQTLCQDYLTIVNEQNLRKFTEYFFETFMKHFRLYQYVVYTDREKMALKSDIDIETPVEPLPFTDSKQLIQWEYEQKVLQVEIVEDQTQTERPIKAAEDNKQNQERLNEEVQNLQEAEVPVANEKLVEMIQDIACCHISSASHAIKSNISDTMEDLGFMLKKTSIPRPQDMGPPPRYKPKTPLGGGTGKRPKSKGKTDSRDKSGGSRASRAAKAK